MARQFVIHFELQDETAQFVEVEIVLNNLCGIANSELIRTYASLDTRFHQIGIVFKHLISNVACFKKTQKLNSYSLLLMVITFLQHKGVLPTLQIGYESDYFDCLFNIKQDDGEYESKVIPLDLGFKSQQSEEEEKTDVTESAFELFKQMMEFYFCSGFGMFEQVINPRTGRFESVKS